MRHRRNPTLILSTAAFVACMGLCRLAGFRMLIPAGLNQILDCKLLSSRPIESLLLMHSQPPMLNGLLAGCIAIARSSGMRAEAICQALMYGVSLLTVLLLHVLVRRLTKSDALAILAVVLLLLDPAFHLHANLMFYELPSLAAQMAVAILAAAYLRRPRTKLLYGLAIALAINGWLRTLYGPEWAVIIFLLIVVLRMYDPGKIKQVLSTKGCICRAAVAPFCLLALLLMFWPLKNFIIFGHFTNSSWIGFNLCRGTGVHDDRLDAFIRDGTISPDLLARQSMPRHLGPQPDNVLSRINRSDGTRNWNHWIFLALDEELRREGMAYRFKHRDRWLGKAASYYLRWGRAAAVHSYTEEPFFVPVHLTNFYLQYASAYTTILHGNLRTMFKPPSASTSPTSKHTAWPVYSILILPLIFILSDIAIWRTGLRRSWRAHTRLFLVVMAALPMIVVILTDGAEGNRMRFSTIGVTTTLFILLVNDLRLRRRQAKRRAAISS